MLMYAIMVKEVEGQF